MSKEIFSKSFGRAYVAEGIATLLFVFLGAGTVVVTGGLLSEALASSRLLVIALAHGLAIAFLVGATAHISGGHINPAVTFAVWVSGKMRFGAGVCYIISQLVGATIGAFLLTWIIPVTLRGTLGAHGLGLGISPGAGFLVEIVLTFVLVLVVLGTAIDPRGLGHVAPLMIGLAVLVGHLIGVPLTGASMNPARSFGPALVSGAWMNHWIYWIGPLLGALLAALVYRFIFEEK